MTRRADELRQKEYAKQSVVDSINWQKKLEEIKSKFTASRPEKVADTGLAILSAIGYIMLITFGVTIISLITNYNKKNEPSLEPPPKVEAPVARPAPVDLAKDLYDKANTICSVGYCTDPQKAIKYLNEAIKLKPDYADAYNNRAFTYLNQGDNISGCSDAKKACELGNCKTLEAAKDKGDCI